MENKITTNKSNNEISLTAIKSAVGRIEDVVDKSIDVSKETELILAMTPKDGYDLKLRLIEKADDMSTFDKIQAIDHAEDKYANDIDNSLVRTSNMQWEKAGFVLAIIIGVTFVVSPKGSQAIKNILKLVA